VVLLGVVSDTHGLLRPDVLVRLSGVDHILHAGDVGQPEILADLEALAPVSAVWGNVDGFDIRESTREWVVEVFEEVEVAVIHGHQAPSFESLPERFPSARVVIHGHSHMPRCDRVAGTLLVNPGSAGPAAPGKPVSMALMEIVGDEVRVRHLDLQSGREFRPGG
jgi:putative phosphoesterase